MSYGRIFRTTVGRLSRQQAEGKERMNYSFLIRNEQLFDVNNLLKPPLNTGF